jgi:transglutaminase-like putative cysteine protease
VHTLLPLFLATLAAPAPAPVAPPADPAPVPEALRLPRPAGGEWLGVYLVGQKAGWAYSSLEEATFEGRPAVKATSRFTLRASVGGAAIERTADEVRWYERKDGGRLLAIEATRRGDGGDRTISGRCTDERCVFRIEGEGAAQERTVPNPGERLEDAEAVRLAAIRHRSAPTRTLDVDELAARRGQVKIAGEERTLVGGVPVRVVRVIAEEEGGVRVEGTVDPATGRTLSLDAGAMTFRAESEERARSGGGADVFALTRVALPSPLPEGAKEVTLVVEGLPDDLRLAGPRQRFETLPGGRVRIRLAAVAPKKRARLPVDRAAFAAELAPTPAIDADAPAIRARAAALVPAGGDAREAALRIGAWVHATLAKGYGTSSDRASRVLEQGRGDCTEHSILFVALARAAGLPARTVHGLVAADVGGTPALYWHQWAQVWVGEWTDVDPTFGQPVADATHLALGQEGSTRAISVMGRLRVVQASGR